MNIKRLIKLLVPPLLLDLYRGDFTLYNWEGVYFNYRDVPVSGQGFNSDTWINARIALTRSVAKEAEAKKVILNSVVGEQSLLPLVVAMLGHNTTSDTITILDFGGGTGIDYIHTLHGIAHCQTIKYHIIDTQRSHDEGTRMFKDDSNIHFHTSLPQHVNSFDVVYINSTLQYVESYAELLRTLCGYQARYMLFGRLEAGEVPTHLSAQKNLKGSTLPYWFFNFDDIVDIMNKNNYTLIFKGAAQSMYDQTNIPELYRLERGCNLLFIRK